MRLSEQDQELGNMTYRIEEFEIGNYSDHHAIWVTHEEHIAEEFSNWKY